VWHNAAALNTARLRGAAEHDRRLADLEAAAAARVQDLLRPGPVLLRLAVRGFGVTIGTGDGAAGPGPARTRWGA
jgi:hypothetical protein